MTLTIITGWIAAILLVFNFATCLVMPWSKKEIEECDGKSCQKEKISMFHKPIAWLSMLAILVHVTVSLVS